MVNNIDYAKYTLNKIPSLSLRDRATRGYRCKHPTSKSYIVMDASLLQSRGWTQWNNTFKKSGFSFWTKNLFNHFEILAFKNHNISFDSVTRVKQTGLPACLVSAAAPGSISHNQFVMAVSMDVRIRLIASSDGWTDRNQG
jgi:hypothetical protein